MRIGNKVLLIHSGYMYSKPHLACYIFKNKVQKLKIFFKNQLFLKIKFLFLRNCFIFPIWIFTFATAQAQITMKAFIKLIRNIHNACLFLTSFICLARLNLFSILSEKTFSYLKGQCRKIDIFWNVFWF